MGAHRLGVFYWPPKHNFTAADYKRIFILGEAYNAKHSYWGFRVEIEKALGLKVKSLKSAEQLNEEAETLLFKQPLRTAHSNYKKRFGNLVPLAIRQLVKEKGRLENQKRNPADKNIVNNKNQALKREI